MTPETLTIVDANGDPLWLSSNGDLRTFPHSANPHTHRILSCTASANGQLAEGSSCSLYYSTDAGKTWNNWYNWSAPSTSRLPVGSPPPVVVDYSVPSENVWVMFDLIEYWDETHNSKMRNPNPSNPGFTDLKLDCEIGGEINAGICKIEPLIGF